MSELRFCHLLLLCGAPPDPTDDTCQPQSAYVLHVIKLTLLKSVSMLDLTDGLFNDHATLDRNMALHQSLMHQRNTCGIHKCLSCVMSLVQADLEQVWYTLLL